MRYGIAVALVLSGCASILGIDKDYTEGSPEVDGAIVERDSSFKPDSGGSVPDATSDASRDAQADVGPACNVRCNGVCASDCSACSGKSYLCESSNECVDKCSSCRVSALCSFTCDTEKRCTSDCRGCNNAPLSCTLCVDAGIAVPQASTCIASGSSSTCIGTCGCANSGQCAASDQVCANGMCQPCGAAGTDGVACRKNGDVCKAEDYKCD
jgi:hypothetical protein